MFELNNTNPNQSLTNYANPASTNILSSQVIPTVYQDLQRFAADPNLNEKLKLTFGSDYNVQTAQTILDNWLIGDFSTIPPIELVEREDIAGANGAFAAATNKIYLSKDILTGEFTNTEAIKDVILEEIGHSIDAMANPVDAPGDEGAIFAATVQGKVLSSEELSALKAEDDRAVVIRGGKPIVIEQNTMSNPQTINNSTGFFTGRQFYSSQSVSTNNDKYYRFTIGSAGRLSVGLKDMYGSADVSLIRDANNNGRVDSGEVLGSSEGSSNKLISGNQLDNLSAGTYYVRVKGNASYGIAVNLDQAGNSRVAGSQGIFSISTARNLPTLSDIAASQDYQFSDFVGSGLGDPVDYYSFRLDTARSLSFALRDMTGNANVYIEDGNGTVLAKSENGGSADELGSLNLAGNTNYYVRVDPVGSESTNYRLVLNPGQVITQIPDSAGNTVSTARQISVDRNGNTWRDWVGSSDNNDYYRFTLNNKSNLNLRLDGLSADANVEILNSSNNVISSSTKSGSNNEEISRTLDAGTYSVRVYPQSGNTYYNLNIKADLNWGRVTRAGQNESFSVGLERVGDDGKGSPRPIESGRNTWVVIHGYKGQPWTGEFPALAKALDAADDQVLTLDWSSIAHDKYGGTFSIPGDSAKWIPTVADWASQKLKDLGFDYGISQNKLNLVGFSLGAYVAAEIASRMPGGVNKIVALDPASKGGIGEYGKNNAPSIRFSNNSQFSWGFYGSAAGDPGIASTADESWSVGFGSNNIRANHGHVVNLFASMVDRARTNSDRVSTYFGINKMGPNIHTPLQLDQYDETGRRVIWGFGDKFEGRLEARQDNNQRWVPQKLEYMGIIYDINTITA